MMNNLDDAAQHSLVQVMMGSGVSRAQAFSVIEYVLLSGKPGGRREAALALADRLTAWMRMRWPCGPWATRIRKFRPTCFRNCAAAEYPAYCRAWRKSWTARILSVRLAAREALAEFSFRDFWDTFDMMDEQARESTAALVKKIDQQTISLLCKELRSAIVSRRLRGLQIVRAMDIADRVEELIVDMLDEEDYTLRAEAAACLGKCRSPAARKALEKALNDGSVTVREAAEKSLQEKS